MMEAEAEGTERKEGSQAGGQEVEEGSGRGGEEEDFERGGEESGGVGEGGV